LLPRFSAARNAIRHQLAAQRARLRVDGFDTIAVATREPVVVNRLSVVHCDAVLAKLERTGDTHGARGIAP
jgi:hypothetical protein